MALPEMLRQHAAFKRAVLEFEGLGQVHLRTPSARGAIELKAIREGAGDRAVLALEAALRHSVCDASGELLFADEKLDPLDFFSIEQANAICLKAVELMTGRTAEQLEAAAKAEEPPQGNASSSSS